MKTPLALLLFLGLLPGTLLGATSREAQWKEVDDAVEKGLPRTAIEKLEPIIQSALQDQAWGEATKAIARRIALEGTIEGDKPEERITRMQAELERAPADIVPLLQTIQAHWYWQYYQQNRWRFLQRTATSQTPGDDFTTWDLPRLFAEIDRQFQKALTYATTLQKTPVATFDAILVRGTLPDRYRPTLYDFIAHEALRFYSAGEQAGAQPQDAFEVSADSPIFDAPEAFVAWNPAAGVPQATNLVTAPLLRAVRLYQDLLKFHRPDSDPTAFVDADLARLVFGHNIAVGESKNSRYRAALKRFIDQWADHEVAAMALYHSATLLQSETNLVEARALALRGKETHPSSPGGKLCHNLIQQIEAQTAQVAIERVWNQPLAPVAVRYRNLTNLHFRVVSWDWAEFLSPKHRRPENLSDAERKAILQRQPALEWSAGLPRTDDFQEHKIDLPAPRDLRPGYYFLVASRRPDFGEQENEVTFTDFWVSNLALVVRPNAGRIEGFVLNAESGEPLAGAEIMAWHLDSRMNRVPTGPVATDPLGFFSFPNTPRPCLLRARYQGQELASAQEYESQVPGKPSPQNHTLFFTDRVLYRPGQTIRFKGICFRIDTEGSNYHVLANGKLTVALRDPNGKDLARADLRCNDYGSFSGSFSAPRSSVLGSMSLTVVAGPSGATSFNVEDYKRPKFQVTMEAPKTGARLNDRVTVTGKAETYTGTAVDAADVRYRVVREVVWPYWWGSFGGWRRPPVQGSQEMAHGTTRTDATGHFTVEFTAKPDPHVSETDDASFTFTVYAEVTDGTGETRSNERRVHLGFTALSARVSAADWQTTNAPVELEIQTTSLDGEPQPAEGIVKVHRLKQPARVVRPLLTQPFPRWNPAVAPAPDLANPNQWDLDRLAAEAGFTTDATGKTKLTFALGAGPYRVLLETQDRYGKKVTARLPLQVLNPADSQLAIKVPHLLAAPTWTVEPGADFTALWGTGYDLGRAFIEVEHRGQLIQRYWTAPGRAQAQIKQTVTEAMRGGFALHVTYVRENRAYLESRTIQVPWSNKDLEVTWEHLTSKLTPAQKESWTASIKRKSGVSTSRPAGAPPASAERAVAEMVATLYDASLDAFLPHHWPASFQPYFRQNGTYRWSHFGNALQYLRHLQGRLKSDVQAVELRYREFPADLVGPPGGMMMMRGGRLAQTSYGLAMPAAAPMALAAEPKMGERIALAEGMALDSGAQAAGVQVDRIIVTGSKIPPPAPDLSQVTARRNLNETAFFFPHLVSDTNGVVRMTFTMPEALTTWRFMGFAHDRDLRAGYLEGKTVTAKDLMVQPNPPRFLREGDQLEFSVKVSNQSATRQSGKVRLTLNQAFDDQSADRALGNLAPELPFDIPPKESRTYAWRLTVPDGMGYLTYKAVAATGRLSDGEEGYLPVLSRRLLVTESLPLPIRGPATKQFRFEKLLESGRSDTLRHQNLVVQAVSNPSWYAVLALPYLMEFPHECTEQTFNRLYANALARSIANANPRIRQVFDQWRNTAALDSPLERNADLKSVALEETPWLRQAQNENQARKNVGVLFDDNRLNDETQRTLQKLAERQLEDGAWPWFPGGRANDYITLYITTGFGRLRHLGVDLDVSPALRSLDRLDRWIDQRHQEIRKTPKPEEHVPTAVEALYLYGRSFFLKDKPVAPEYQSAVNFFLGQARKHWLKAGSRQSQGHLALALQRFSGQAGSNDPTPAAIMRSLKERAVTNEEMGMFWRDTEYAWWWYHAPIETQALMVEAFDEVAKDPQAVEECKVWLLKQKQTQDWKTTKATADAVYALLLRGHDLLASTNLLEITLGNLNLTPARPAAPTAPTPGARLGSPPASVEPGTGFYERRFAAAEIKPDFGQVTVKKPDPGVAWGSVHWQYLEDMTRITPHQATPLKLNKALFRKRNAPTGPVLESVKERVSVGDELVVRIELRVDRDLEYVHLKDQRGSGTEPVNVLSHYRYQDGLAYYEVTRDTASHFFIDYLPKGTYVFEYATRVQHRGQYQTGIADIQCMYAPEFNSHSQSFTLVAQ